MLTIAKDFFANVAVCEILSEVKMKGLVILVILGGLAYGGMWLYENHYFDDFLGAVDNTVQRTSDFATDKAVKEADF